MSSQYFNKKGENYFSTDVSTIYPLTIINCRYIDYIIVFNAHSDASVIIDLQLFDYSLLDNPLEYIDNKITSFDILYGIGNTLNTALTNYFLRNGK
jgi:hypothetical protein